jgi:hypothetical protein
MGNEAIQCRFELNQILDDAASRETAQEILQDQDEMSERTDKLNANLQAEMQRQHTEKAMQTAAFKSEQAKMHAEIDRLKHQLEHPTPEQVKMQEEINSLRHQLSQQTNKPQPTPAMPDSQDARLMRREFCSGRQVRL